MFVDKKVLANNSEQEILIKVCVSKIYGTYL